MSRNTQTCWTCRIRHKGCEGPGPNGDCDVCIRLNIECLKGYGARLPTLFRHHEITDTLSQWNRSRAGRSSSNKLLISPIYSKLRSETSNNALGNINRSPPSSPARRPQPGGLYPVTSVPGGPRSMEPKHAARDISYQPHPAQGNMTIAHHGNARHDLYSQDPSTQGAAVPPVGYSNNMSLGQFEMMDFPTASSAPFLPYTDMIQQFFVPSNAPYIQDYWSQCAPQSARQLAQEPPLSFATPDYSVNSDVYGVISSFPQSYVYNTDTSTRLS